MPFAQVNGQRLFFEDSGGAGPAVLFSHGFLMDHEMFDAQVAALSGPYRCVTWDQRGHGATRAGGPFTYWDSADDALALLDDLGIERAAFAGMSQGGFVSLRAALRAPGRVAALVLIDTQAGLEDAGAVPAYDAMHDEWVAHGPGEVQELVADMILGRDADAGPWFAKWAAMPPDQLTAPYRCLMGRYDITGHLGEIAAPAIVLHGDQDVAIPMERAEALCAGLAACEGVVVVRGAGHASNLTHPEQVNPVLRRFLDPHF
ncbi:MAG: alpha/beta hydrolase [Actinomycetota bacterium]|jgi:pimeloyl-ACP methyl ester carboxylesterase|nr:alpha/beta hydrolase [Actinomycetota bacterium]